MILIFILMQSSKLGKGKFLFLLLSLTLFSCKENSVQIGDKMTDDYHRKALEIKGDSLYFVSRATVDSFLKRTSTIHLLAEVQINDNISFLDEYGNIRYQVICSDVKKHMIFIECTNLKTKMEYQTTISVNDYNNIIDLYKFDIDTVIVFREIM